MRSLHLLLYVLTILALGMRAADAHTAVAYSDSATSAGAVVSVSIDATANETSHPCNPASEQESHSGCLLGSGGPVIATLADVFDSPAEMVGLRGPLSASRIAGTDVLPPLHPPKLSIRA